MKCKCFRNSTYFIGVNCASPVLRILCMCSHLNFTIISEMGFIILFLLLGKMWLPQGKMTFQVCVALSTLLYFLSREIQVARHRYFKIFLGLPVAFLSVSQWHSLPCGGWADTASSVSQRILMSVPTRCLSRKKQ